MKEYQVEGPDWLTTERSDVSARFPEGFPRDREGYNAAFGAMMQKMLADRFKLVVHRGHKTFSVYGLTVMKSGIKFKEVRDEGSHSNGGNSTYSGTSITMEKFAEFLSRKEDLPVIDMTGLKGFYSLTLKWVPDSPQLSKNDTPAADRPIGPSLPEALEGQLGLSLENRRASIEILVVITPSARLRRIETLGDSVVFSSVEPDAPLELDRAQ